MPSFYPLAIRKQIRAQSAVSQATNQSELIKFEEVIGEDNRGNKSSKSLAKDISKV